jgi:hypothetical protein
MVIIEEKIIESLRRGIPPQKGVDLYSVGNEKFIEGIKNFHLSKISNIGKIRFISGSWGSGKTHFFRLLRELAYKNSIIVSSVELSIDSAPFNKFEEIFYSIIRNISTSTFYDVLKEGDIIPFGSLIEDSLKSLGNYPSSNIESVSFEHFTDASEKLMKDRGIDIDFKKMIKHYWETYLPDKADYSVAETKREEILQWFAGVGTISTYRKAFGVNKMVSRNNARLMLHSLSEFVKLAGYQGLLILLDEAEQSYSVMRKAALKIAHTNLLSLINNIESNPGIFMIYATTPDFFTDPKHGITIYGALAGRIGKLEEKQPMALSSVWNLDAIKTELKNYQDAALKIRKIYFKAYPEAEEKVLNETQTTEFVEKLNEKHPKLSAVNFWRVMIKSIITKFDLQLEDADVPIDELYVDIMDRLRED